MALPESPASGMADGRRPLRVSAGGFGRPVRMRDRRALSRIRLADRAHLEPGFQRGRRVDRPAHGCRLAGGKKFGSAFEARNGRMLPYVIELDGSSAAGWTIGNVAPRA